MSPTRGEAIRIVLSLVENRTTNTDDLMRALNGREWPAGEITELLAASVMVAFVIADAAPEAAAGAIAQLRAFSVDDDR